MSGRVEALVAVVLTSACGSVDLGQDVQFSEITYDQNYFYCKVEPMLIEQKCGPGESTDKGGCHYTIARFKLTEHVPATCDGLTPTVIPPEARSNYLAAQRKMTPDPERAPLLNHPTNRVAHPRKIFEADSAPAEIIREWATKYTSQ